MAPNRHRPFAYTVHKAEFVFSVRPTLPSAMEAARDRFPTPSILLDITGWFADGTSQDLPHESLISGDRSGWITAEEAVQLEAALFPSLTMREQVTSLRRNNPGADYWEKLVVKFAEALLAQVDQDLRGIAVEDSGIEGMSYEEYLNLPSSPIELLDRIATPKRWIMHQEGRRRLGFATMDEEMDAMEGKSGKEIRAEYARRREALRSLPFIPSQTPFPSGDPEE